MAVRDAIQDYKLPRRANSVVTQHAIIEGQKL